LAAQVADVLLSRLREWGVEQVFAYPGDGINGLVSAWGRADDAPQFVQTRHEEMAAFAAVGYAKFSGRPGFCVATSGPGAIHLLNGLYDAKLDHVPVVAIVGQTDRTAMGGSYQQEVDLLSAFKDCCHQFVQVAMVPEQFPNLLDRAIRTAVATRSPTCVIVPADLQEQAYEAPGHAFKMVPSSLGIDQPELAVDGDAVRRAADVLNSGERVAILVGQGARGAAAEVTEVADVLGAGVAKALLGKDVLSDDLPWVTGAIGILGTRPSYELMRDCDTLLTVGASFPYTQFLPELGKARGVQIDIDGSMIGLRYPYEVNLVADAGAALRALLPHLRRRSDRSWRDGVEANVAGWWDTVQRQAMTDSDKDGVVNPQRLFWELSERLPADAVVAADSGSGTNWYARHLRFRGEVRGSLSGTLATMGCGVPYAIGAKWALPDRPAIALVGDGAMQMNGMAELLTIARYWRQWRDPRLVVAVLHNGDLNHVTWELRAMGGAPRFGDSQGLPDVSYAAFAAGIGLASREVRSADEIGPAWDAALAADRPMVLDVHTDGDVPPVPPHATFDQMKATAQAMLHDEDKVGMAKAGIRQKLSEALPGRKDG
jgi:pyruvate dehydrogenase (quinone)